MTKTSNGRKSPDRTLPKAPTGIQGLDEITGGGLPRGRPTLVCGSAGCGKTLLAMEFLVRGRHAVRRARRLPGLRGDRRGTGPERPLARLRPGRAGRAEEARWSTTSTSSAARSRRPASTTWKGCSSASGTPSTPSGPSGSCWTPSRRSSAACPTPAVLRAELRRLFRWLKDKGVTAVITAERGDGDADPARPGGVRLRLRDPARPPGQRTGLHAAPAHRQVPRHRRTAPTSTPS